MATLFLLRTGWTEDLTRLELHKYSTLPRDTLEALNSKLLNFLDLGRHLTVIRSPKEPFYIAPIRMYDIAELQHTLDKETQASPSIKFPLQRILGSFLTSESSQPEDRVYAFLGLVPMASWQGLTVDYARPASDTFIQATRAMINATKSLSVLSLVEDRKFRTESFKKLPSWVPDFTAPHSTQPLDPGDKGEFAGFPGSFDCTRGSSYENEAADTLSSCLEVLGYFHSAVAIEDISEPREVGRGYLEQSKAMLDCIRKQPRNCLWRTLISDHDIWDGSFPATTRSAQCIFMLWISNLHSTFSRLGNSVSRTQSTVNDIDRRQMELKIALDTYVALAEDRRILEFIPNIKDGIFSASSIQVICSYLDSAYGALNHGHLSNTGRTNHEILTDCDRVIGSMKSHMSCRVLFTTSDDHIGKGPCSTQSRDEIWILRGARVPYILRPVGGARYELIGEAYVHGIMQGEEFDEMEGHFRPIEIV